MLQLLRLRRNSCASPWGPPSAVVDSLHLHIQAQKISYLLSICKVSVIFKSKTLSNVPPTTYRNCELSLSVYSFIILFTGISMGGVRCVSVVNLLTEKDMHLV